MVSTKYEVEKLDDKDDLGLWRVKMWTLLVQHGVFDALRHYLVKTYCVKTFLEKEKDILDKAHSVESW